MKPVVQKFLHKSNEIAANSTLNSCGHT